MSVGDDGLTAHEGHLEDVEPCGRPSLDSALTVHARGVVLVHEPAPDEAATVGPATEAVGQEARRLVGGTGIAVLAAVAAAIGAVWLVLKGPVDFPPERDCGYRRCHGMVSRVWRLSQRAGFGGGGLGAGKQLVQQLLFAMAVAETTRYREGRQRGHGD